MELVLAGEAIAFAGSSRVVAWAARTLKFFPAEKRVPCLYSNELAGESHRAQIKFLGKLGMNRRVGKACAAAWFPARYITGTEPEGTQWRLPPPVFDGI